MPRYHGCWSVGVFVGAALGTLAARAGVPLGVHFGTDAVVVAVGVTAALPWFLPDPPPTVLAGPAGPDRPDRPDRADGARPDRRTHAYVTRRLVLIGIVTLCATCIEGAAADWLALYLRDDRGTDAGLAAAGYAVFAVAMAASRFSGTTVIDRVGRVAAVRAGGVLAGLGVLGAVLAPGVAGALLGGLLWGLGVAVIFPAAMSAGGETPGHSAQGIATVATIGYGGFLLGPPLIGLLAQHLGLGSALLMLPVLALSIVVLAPSVRRTESAPTRS
jgi:fucose permease